MPLAAVMALVSLALCILGSPAAVAGIVVNIVILGMIAYVQVVGSAARLGRLRPGTRGMTK